MSRIEGPDKQPVTYIQSSQPIGPKEGVEKSKEGSLAERKVTVRDIKSAFSELKQKTGLNFFEKIGVFFLLSCWF